MKKLIIFLIFIFLGLTGCKKESKDIKIENESKDTKIEGKVDDKKDRFGREYQDGAIVIKSDELRDMLLDFLTCFTSADEKMLDYLYLNDEQKEGFKNLLSTKEGKEIVSKVANGTSIETEGIPDAIYLKSEIDKDGNSFQSETRTNITATGPCYKNFIDVLKIKNEKAFSDFKTFSDYLDRFIELYPAKNKLENAFDFCYVNGRPLIKGDTFIEYFGIFKDVNKKTKTALDLVSDGFKESVKVDEDIQKVLDELSKCEYVEAYKILNEKRVNQIWDFDPKPTIKKLFTSPDEVRAKFLLNMRKLPNPLIKTFIDNGKKKTMIIYYYKDNYAPEATGLMTEDIFTMTNLEDFSGVLFENIINNTLAENN